MLDSDISTADALAHLSVAEPAGDRATLDRRRFLQLIGMGLGAGAVGSVLGSPVLDRDRKSTRLNSSHT